MCVLCDGKRNIIETILVISIFLTLLSETIQEKRKNHCSFVGSCLVSTVSRHVRLTEKEHTHNHKVVAELVFLFEKEDIVVNKIPREWVLLRFSTMSMINDYEEILTSSQLKTKKNLPNHWLEHIAQSRQINVQQEVESQQRFQLSLMDQRPGLSTWS